MSIETAAVSLANGLGKPLGGRWNSQRVPRARSGSSGFWFALPSVTILAWSIAAVSLNDASGMGRFFAHLAVQGTLSTLALALSVVVLLVLLLASNLERDKAMAVAAVGVTALVFGSAALRIFVHRFSESSSTEQAQAMLVAFAALVGAVHVFWSIREPRWRVAAAVVGCSALSPFLGAPLVLVFVVLCLGAGVRFVHRGTTGRPASYAIGVLLVALATAEMLIASSSASQARTTAAIMLLLVGLVGVLLAALTEVRQAYICQCVAAREAELAASVVQARVGAATHDRRAALAAIEGALITMRVNAAQMSTEELVDLAAATTSEFARLRRMVALAEIERPDRIQVAQTVYPFLRCRRELGTRVELRGDLSAEVVASPDVLAWVVQNLVDNAVEHGRASLVAVEVKRQRSGWIDITVSDDGIGVNEAVHDVIFAPGVSAHPTEHTGQGLTRSREAIEALGGTIDVIPLPPNCVGARFRVSLPDPDSVDLSVPLLSPIESDLVPAQAVSG